MVSSSTTPSRAGCERVAIEMLESVYAALRRNPDTRRGNRGWGRFSFGVAQTTRMCAHEPEWTEMVAGCPAVLAVLDTLWGGAIQFLTAAETGSVKDAAA